MSARTREFRITLNHDDLLRCEAAKVAPEAFVNSAVRAALAELPDPSEEEEEEVADQDTVSGFGHGSEDEAEEE